MSQQTQHSFYPLVLPLVCLSIYLSTQLEAFVVLLFGGGGVFSFQSTHPVSFLGGHRSAQGLMLVRGLGRRDGWDLLITPTVRLVATRVAPPHDGRFKLLVDPGPLTISKMLLIWWLLASGEVDSRGCVTFGRVSA